MFRKFAALAVLLASSTVAAQVDPRFEKLRESAEPVGGLRAFLEKYIGDCSDPFAAADCREASKTFRKQVAGKRYYMIVSEDSANMVSAGPYNPANDEYSIRVVPMFAAGGYAVTHGKPRKLDAAGNPVLHYLTITGELPEGWTPPQFMRLFSSRQVKLQVVFKPEGVWSLPKRGGGKLEGIQAKVEGVRVLLARTGDPLGVWIAPR